MNTKTKKKLKKEKKIWAINKDKKISAKNQTEKMQREIEKLQNRSSQIVNSENEKEIERIRLSKTPKQKTEILDTKLYRRQRSKQRKQS
jgi:stress response protein SCP2